MERTIEDAFDKFERVLDDEFKAMNINDNNKHTFGYFVLPSPPPSSDEESESGESETGDGPPALPPALLPSSIPSHDKNASS